MSVIGQQGLDADPVDDDLCDLLFMSSESCGCCGHETPPPSPSPKSMAWLLTSFPCSGPWVRRTSMQLALPMFKTRFATWDDLVWKLVDKNCRTLVLHSIVPATAAGLTLETSCGEAELCPVSQLSRMLNSKTSLHHPVRCSCVYVSLHLCTCYLIVVQNLDLLFISVPNSQLLLNVTYAFDVPHLIVLKTAAADCIPEEAQLVGFAMEFFTRAFNGQPVKEVSWTVERF